MTIEIRLKGFNASNAKSFYKVLNWKGLTYEKSNDNNIRIIKFEADFKKSREFIGFCDEIFQKFIERKTQKDGRYNEFDYAINSITQPYLAVFTLQVKEE